MSIASENLTKLRELAPNQLANLLHADLLAERLDVWATLVFEEFWNGYGMGSGFVYQDTEKYPFAPLMADLNQRGIGLCGVRKETLEKMAKLGVGEVPHLVDFEDDYSLSLIISEMLPASRVILNFLTFDDLYQLLAENRESNLVDSGRVPQPQGQQLINICLTDYLETPDWVRLQQIIKLGYIADGKLVLPLWEGSGGSLTLQLQVWGKLVTPNQSLPNDIFRELLKLAKLGLTQLDYALFYDYGFTANDHQVWSVPATSFDYTQQIRDLAAKLRRFMQNKDTQKAGIKLPQLLVVNPPQVDEELLIGTDLPAGDFWIEAPTYALWRNQIHPTAFELGE